MSADILLSSIGEDIKNLIQQALEQSGKHYWYTLPQAFRSKFGLDGVAFSSICNCQALQPRGGIPDAWQSGKKTWTQDTVDEWCKIDDLRLQSYLDRVAPGRRAPARIRSRFQDRDITL
jgi:hypothetical protein